MTREHRRRLRVFRARPRLFIATAFGLGVAAFLPHGIASQGVTRWLVSWNAGTVLYVFLAAVMMIRSTDRHMRQRAQLHYAHEYYAVAAADGRGGLHFPGDAAPGYGDFFYFSTVIGTSGQTADVAFTSKSMRRIGTLHCMLAFFYNTTVLALLINIGASMI